MYQMIKHVMADGTVRDSVAGLTVPKESRAYEVLQRIKGGGKSGVKANGTSDEGS